MYQGSVADSGPARQFRLLKEHQARQSTSSLHGAENGNKVSGVRLKVNKLSIERQSLDRAVVSPNKYNILQ